MMRILVVEYLHADSEAFRAAAHTMRQEGRMMLSAVLDDIRDIDGVVTTTALCAAAEEEVVQSDLMITVGDGSESDFTERLLTACDDHSFDKALVIAPESDGILSTIVRRLRHSGIDVIAPSLQATATCADKLATHKLLERLRVPCVATRPLNEFHHLNLNDNDFVVVKPTNGAGCESIVRLKSSILKRLLADATHAPPLPVDNSPAYLRQPSKHVVQRFVDAESLSIGLVGRGQGKPALQLPVARQSIEWNGERPSYRGGTILPEVSARATQAMQQMAATIAGALNLKSGYVGIDFLYEPATREVYVSEINPRLCTSYVGYRKATDKNLAELLLRTTDAVCVIWSEQPVDFQVFE